MSDKQNDDILQSTTPKPFVFVLMPFDRSFDDIYKFGIKGAAEQVGAYAERVDEQIFTEGILDRIFSEINKADVVVADMTGRNPNVFYEVGYAHALGKIVLLVTRDANDIPFDLQHQQHTVYGGSIDTLKSELARKLRWAITNPKARSADVVVTLQFSRLDSRPPKAYILEVHIANDGLETIERFSLQIEAPHYQPSREPKNVRTADLSLRDHALDRCETEFLSFPDSTRTSLKMTYWSPHPLLPGQRISLTSKFRYGLEFRGFDKAQVLEWFRVTSSLDNSKLSWSLYCDRRPSTNGQLSLSELFEAEPSTSVWL